MNSDAPSLRESLEPSLNEALMLLSEGLDLCARARKLDEAITQAIAAGDSGEGTRCLTPAVWVQDAYDNALTDWEARSKAALSRLAPFVDHLPEPSGITALLRLAHAQSSESNRKDSSSPQAAEDS